MRGRECPGRTLVHQREVVVDQCIEGFNSLQEIRKGQRGNVSDHLPHPTLTIILGGPYGIVMNPLSK